MTETEAALIDAALKWQSWLGTPNEESALPALLTAAARLAAERAPSETRPPPECAHLGWHFVKRHDDAVVNLTDVIVELEQAKIGNPHLDNRIAEYFRYDRYASYVSRWTTSIDAAITLIPEGWGADIFWHDGASADDAFVALRLHAPKWGDPDCPPEQSSVYVNIVQSHDDCTAPTHGKPLPLAICLAAMRAHSYRKNQA